MAIDPSVNAFSPMNFEQLAQMQEVNQEAIQQMAQETVVSDSLTIAEGDAYTFNPDPGNPQLQSPDFNLINQRWTPDQQIALLLGLDNEALGNMLATLTHIQALLDAGFSKEEIAAQFRMVLQNSANSPYSAEHLAKRTIGEMMERALAENPDAEMEQAWFSLRAEMLVDVSPHSAILINLIKQELIKQGMSEAEAQAMAEKLAVSAVDKGLSENGVVTPFYGMHPEMGAAVNAILAKNIADMESIGNPQEFAVFLEDMGTAHKWVMEGLTNAIAVDQKGSNPVTDAEAKETIETYKNEAETLLTQLDELLAGLPDFPGKVALLAMMKMITDALANFSAAINELEKIEHLLEKKAAQSKVEDAKETMKARIADLEKALKEYRDLKEKMEKMKESMGVMTIISDVISAIMIAILGSLFVVMSGIVLGALVGVFGFAIVMMVAEIILPLLGCGLSIVVAIVFLIIAIVCLCFWWAGSAGIWLAVVVAVAAVIVEIIIATIFFIIEASLMGAFILLLAVWVIIFVVWLALFLLLALVIASYAVTKETDVTDQLATAVGPAAKEMFKMVGINVEDMNTIYTIISIMPIVLIVVIALLPILLIILAVVVVVIAVVAVVVVAVVAVVVLVVIYVIAIVLALLLAVFVMVIWAIAFVALAVVLVVAVVVILVLVLVALLLVLLAIVVIAVITALFPAALFVVLQFVPIFIAKSGMLGKMAGKMGEVMGLSEEETEELEMVLYGLNAAVTASAGGQVVKSHYSVDANAEREAMEYDKITDLEQLAAAEAALKKFEAFLARFGAESLNAENAGRKRDLEDEIAAGKGALQQILKILRKILELLSKGFSGAQAAMNAPTSGQQGMMAAEALGNLVVGACSEVNTSMAELMPNVDPQMAQMFQMSPEAMKKGGPALGKSIYETMQELLPTPEFFAEANARDRQRYQGGEDDEEELHKQFSSISQIMG